MKRIGVVGAGAWGTALAVTAARASSEVTLWAREPEVVASINGRQKNEMFLPGIKLPDTVHAVNDLGGDAGTGCAVDGGTCPICGEHL